MSSDDPESLSERELSLCVTIVLLLGLVFFLVLAEVLNHANLNTDADMWITPRLSAANVADTFKFIGFGLWLES